MATYVQDYTKISIVQMPELQKVVWNPNIHAFNYVVLWFSLCVLTIITCLVSALWQCCCQISKVVMWNCFRYIINKETTYDVWGKTEAVVLATQKTSWHTSALTTTQHEAFMIRCTEEENTVSDATTRASQPSLGVFLCFRQVQSRYSGSFKHHYALLLLELLEW